MRTYHQSTTETLYGVGPLRRGYDVIVPAPAADVAAMAARLGVCVQCRAKLNPVAAMVGPVCGKCCRANHKASV